MASGKRWTRDEVLLALHLYERIPFGQQHQGNAQVIALAARLGRTPSSIAMKLNNLTSLDPEEAARGVAGLPGASELDRLTWASFRSDPAVVLDAERLWEEWNGEEEGSPEGEAARAWLGATERVALRSVRLAQQYFRRVVLTNFDGRCALTGIDAPALLVASHIVGWAVAPEHRVNPRNGLCLNRLHDAAFDRHLITFDEQLRLVLGRALRERMPGADFDHLFSRHEGQPLRGVARHEISRELLRRHQEEFHRLAG
jgi:hypothetical protein